MLTEGISSQKEYLIYIPVKNGGRRFHQHLDSPLKLIFVCRTIYTVHQGKTTCGIKLGEKSLRCVGYQFSSILSRSKLAKMMSSPVT